MCDYFEVPVEVVFSLQPFPRLAAESAQHAA
jgi:putative transcriptional regulator